MTLASPFPAPLSAADLPRVLVVDDDRDAADMLAQLLCLNGIDARPAFGGQHAIGLAATFDPDVIFLDLGMPVMDGYEVIRVLRGDLHSQATIVALTAWDDPKTLERVVAAGFDLHMAKPSSLAAVLHVVAERAQRLPPAMPSRPAPPGSHPSSPAGQDATACGDAADRP